MSTAAPLQNTTTKSPLVSNSFHAGLLLQRKCACGGSPSLAGEGESCKKKKMTLQRKAVNQAEPTEVPPVVHEVLRSSGQPLDAGTRDFMEPRFGHDFSQVRVHTDAKAAESAREVNALAYTVGRDVVFGLHRYSPRSEKGLLLIAHELAHTVQQREGESQLPLPAAGTGMETEAARAATTVSSGGAVALGPGSYPISLARQEERTSESKISALGEFHAAAEPENYWEITARYTLGAASYAAYCDSLPTISFFGPTAFKGHPELQKKLQDAETDLRSRKGPRYRPPPISRTFKAKQAMHGWGMAVDFDVLVNPYVLNESGEKNLDVELRKTYDNIAQFMLGKSSSDLRKLTSGRAAFGGTISGVYEALREESGAMKRYFSMMNDDGALRMFLDGEWALHHPGQQPPEMETVKSTMRNDYEVLGGATAAGGKRPAGAGEDRPFAPRSSGGVGNPATEFLNLEKDFVEALTAAGLAWGAVDFGNQSGDIQHFDLRLAGIGKRVYDPMLKWKE